MFGFSELQILCALMAAAVAVEQWRLRHAGPNLILREFRVDGAAPSGEVLYILGRRSGLIAFFLALFGLDPQTSFSVTRREVARDTVGPSGFESTYAPLSEVSASRCSYYRAFWVLVLSLLIYAYGLYTFAAALMTENDYVRQSHMAQASYTLWITLIGGTLLYAWYAASKSVLLSVVAGETEIGIAFREGVIEGVDVGLAKATEAADLINSHIPAKNRGTE